MSSHCCFSFEERCARDAGMVSTKKTPLNGLGKPTAALLALNEKMLKKSKPFFSPSYPASQKSFPGGPIRLVCCGANDDDGGCQSQSGAGSVARGSSGSKRWRQ